MKLELKLALKQKIPNRIGNKSPNFRNVIPSFKCWSIQIEK